MLTFYKHGCYINSSKIERRSKVEKERKIKTLSVIALVVAVLGLTVAFAALSTTLTINGTATLDAATWDIHFENAETTTMTKTGGATVEHEPTLEGTMIKDWNVVLTKPGDSVTYEFKVKNNGTIDAKIGTLTKNKLQCSSLSNVDVDADIACKNLTYELKYKNGNEVKAEDKLANGETKELVLTLAYKQEAEDIPSDDVSISNLDITIIYVQD